MPKDIDDLIPGINWLVYALTEDVGWTEWIQMTPEEQKEFTARTGSDYTNKVIHNPIPQLEGIIDLERGKYVATFNNERCKQLYLALAKRYKFMESEYYRILSELKAEHWKDVNKETPCKLANGGAASACSAGSHPCLITSPALRYIFINGVANGYYKCNNGGTGKDAGKWFILYGGKRIEYTPTHFRDIPPSHPDDEIQYEKIENEIKELKAKLKD